MIHLLKTEKEYFQKIADGLKPFEIRRNDRDYQTGDFLVLQEGILGTHGFHPTGRFMLVEVTDVMFDERFCKAGYVTMTIEPCLVSRGALAEGNDWRMWNGSRFAVYGGAKQE